MEFTALFLAVTIVMLAAWRGTRTLALALFAARRLRSDLPSSRQRRAETVVLRGA